TAPWWPPWAALTTCSSLKTAAFTRRCTISCCARSAASCPMPITRLRRWPGCRWLTCRHGWPTPMSAASCSAPPRCSRTQLDHLGLDHLGREAPRVTPRLSRGAAAILVAVLGLLIAGVLPGVAVGQTLQPPPRPNTLARLELSDLSPRVVTVTSAPVLRVIGRVVNVGDHPISQLQIRLQRDEAVNSDEAVTRAIQGDAEAPHVTRFQPVAGDLAPGRSSPFQLDVPLVGGPDLDSLQITSPGVYPLLINLNGK